MRHNGWEVTYDIGVIHPQDVSRSQPFALFSVSSSISPTVAVTVSARNRRGVVEDSFTVSVSKEPIGPSDVGLA